MTGIETKALRALLRSHPVAAILIAFGVTAPIPDFFGGLVLAFGACYAVMILMEPTSRLSFWTTIFLGGLGALFAAILHQHVDYIRGFPLQAVMGTAGACSKFIAEAIISFGQGLKEWAGTIPSNWKFPGTGDDK